MYIFNPKEKSMYKSGKLNYGWTVLHSNAGFFPQTCSPQERFRSWFLCFKRCIFSRGDSRKSFSHPCLNEGLNHTSERQEDVLKSGFLWSCSGIVAAGNGRYYPCGDTEDGIEWRKLSLLLSNSFKRALLLCESARHCFFPECYCNRSWQTPFTISGAHHAQTCY